MKSIATFLLLGMLAFGQAQVTDVPATRVNIKSETISSEVDHVVSYFCSDGGHPTKFFPRDKEGRWPVIPEHPDLGCVAGIKWGCADKSAILLTAEDGTRHCLKLGTPVPVSDSAIGYEAPTGALLMQQPNVFEFIDHNKMIVSMSNKGGITFGEGYTPNAAGKAFWEEISKLYRLSCVPAEEPAKKGKQ